MKNVLQIVKCFLGLGLQTGLCKQLDKSLIRSTWLVLCVRPLAVSRIMCWLKRGSGWYILAILFCASDLLNRSRFCVCVCKRWIHVGICQWSAQSPVLPICIPPVCQMGLGGLRSGKSSFFQEEQQVLSMIEKKDRGSHLSKTGGAWPCPWAGGWSLHDITFLSPMEPGQQRTGLMSQLCSRLLAAGDGVSASRTERRTSGCMVQALLLAEWGLQADLAHVIHGDAEQKRPSDFSSNWTIIAKCNTCHPACLLLKMPVFRAVNKHAMKRLQWDVLPCSTAKPCMKCDQPSHLVPVSVSGTGPHD